MFYFFFVDASRTTLFPQVNSLVSSKRVGDNFAEHTFSFIFPKETLHHPSNPTFACDTLICVTLKHGTCNRLETYSMHATGSASVFDVKGRGGAVVALQDGQGIGILVRRHGDPAFGRQRTFYTTVALWPCFL